MQKIIVSLCALVLFGACTPAVKVAVPTNAHVFMAPYDELRDAALNHISSHYTITHIDMEAGIIQASFTTTIPSSVLDCGKIQDTGTLEDGTSFTYTYNGADSPVYTMTKVDDAYMHNTRTLQLTGNLELVLTSLDKNTSALTIKTEYTLNKTNVYTSAKKTSRYASTQKSTTEKQSMTFHSGEVGTFSKNEQKNSEHTEQSTEETPDRVFNQTDDLSENTMQCVDNSNIENSIIEILSKHLQNK